MHTRAVLGVAALLLALSATPPAAEETAPSNLFNETVEVRVVNVDVHVTDKRGQPINGLTADDFVLFADGRPVDISNFSATQAETTRRVEAESLPLPVSVQAPEAVALSDQSADELLVVIYFDNYWLTPFDRRRVLDDIEQFVRSQEHSDLRFLVATHDPGLNLQTAITRDASAVLTALAAIPDMPARGGDARRERSRAFQNVVEIHRSWEETPFCSPCACGWEEMLSSWRSFAESSTGRLRIASEGMRQLLSALAGIPDRKAVLYVAAGLEQRPALDILQYIIELCPERQREGQQHLRTYDESTSLLELGADANTSRVTFYPLDAGGARTEGSASVEWDNFKFRPSALVTRIERDNYLASLQMMASATGGQAISNANQPFERLMKLKTDFTNVYSLGFQPTGEPDGRTHRLRVELKQKRRGVRVRYRQSYIDHPLDRRFVDRAIAAITFSQETNPLGVEVSIGEPTRLAKNIWNFPVEVQVAPARLTLVAGEHGSRSGRFRVFLAAREANGDRTLLREKFFDITPETSEQETVSIIVNMSLEPGEYTIGVGVRDEIGAETSYLTVAALSPTG